MKRFKLNLAMLAMMVAVTAAFAFKPASPRRDLQQYGNESAPGDDTHWVLNTREEGEGSGDYSCTLASKPCTAFFSSQPSDGTPAPVSPDTEQGQFNIIP